jgi:DHA2 family multidrug resistance protein
LPQRPTNPWLVTIAVTVGTLMGALDTSVVNVALDARCAM